MSKRKVLNFTEKIKVTELSKWKSVGKTQINNILKRKAEILCEVDKMLVKNERELEETRERRCK